jgi:hypothetical protein
LGPTEMVRKMALAKKRKKQANDLPEKFDRFKTDVRVELYRVSFRR